MRLSWPVIVAMFACLLLTAPAFSGDDDKASAYKIYIDPETGKYTTEDPHAAAALAAVALPSSGRNQDDSHWRLVSVAAVILALSLAVVLMMRRRQTTARLR